MNVDESKIELPCYVRYVRFRADSGFAVLSACLNPESSKYEPDLEDEIQSRFDSKDWDQFAVTLNMLGAAEKIVDTPFVFIGGFKSHKKYGHQFHADFYYIDQPSTVEGLRAYLMTLPNIKESRSRDIISTFGIEGTIAILDDDPHRLTEINGITESRVKPIKDAWDKDRALRELFVWLGDHGISHALGQKIYKQWGNQSVETIEEDPYRLTEIYGIGFGMADAIAHKILATVPKNYRTRACIQFSLQEALRQDGSLCMPYTSLKKVVAETIYKSDKELNISSDLNEYVQLVPEIIRANLDLFTAVKDVGASSNNGSFVYLKRIWDKEKYIAQSLYDRWDRGRHSHKTEDSSNIDNIICDLERKM